MMFGRPPQGYWLGNQFIHAPMPQQQGLLAPQAPIAPQAQAPVAQQSFFQSQIDGGGSNTVGGAQTSTAAAPGGFSSSGQANRASSPSVSSPSMSTVGNVAGTLASIGLGVPGLGPVAGAIGTAVDVSRQNDMLSGIGLNRDVSFGPALASNMSFGVFGTNPDQQRTESIGRDFANLGDLSGLSLAGDMSTVGMESPLASISTPAGLLSGFFGNYSPAMGDLTALGSPGLGGYGNLGTQHSYGFVDGNLVGNFTGNETGTQGQGGGGGGAMGGHGGQGGEGFGGSDPDGNGNWRRGGPTGNDGDKKLEAIRGTLHEDEFVIRPEATAYYGQGLLKAINERRIPRGMLFG